MDAKNIFMVFSMASQYMTENLSKGPLCSSNQDTKHVRVTQTKTCWYNTFNNFINTPKQPSSFNGEAASNL
jgi:hypothetical protein